MPKAAMSRIAALLLALAVSINSARADNPKPVNIPAGDLTAALELLEKQSGVEIVYRPELLKGLRTGGARGTLSSGQAVTMLLKGTSLELHSDRTGVLLITPAGSGGAGIASSGDEAPAATHRHDDAQGDGKNTSRDFRVAELDQADTGTGVDRGQLPVLQEVVVTAQKREERLQDVPVPVTALDASGLARTSQLRLQDYFSSVPGLSLTPDDNGGAFLSIRGITTGYGTNPTVGITIDDVPYGASATAGNALLSVAPDIDPNELQRVEVLRGPQGTLYGASSMGGLLKFVTTDPSSERLSGQVQVGMNGVYNGNSPGYNVDGSINVPISDTVAVRASGFTRRDPGFIDNIATGQHAVNEADFYGGRTSILWHPSEDFSLKLSALLQDSEAHGSSYATLGLGDLQQDNLAGTGLFSRRIQAYSANLNANVGGIQLTSITAYSNTSSSDTIDLGPAGFTQYTSQQFGVNGTAERDQFNVRKFTQELRLSSSIGGWFDWLVGGFYDHENTPITTTISAEDATSGARVGQWLNTSFPTTFDEYAGFADLTFHITNRFDIQVGGRESRDKESISQSFEGVYVPLFLGAVSPYILPPVNSSTNAFTYLVSPRLKLSENWTVYARLASGYRPGGPNDSPGVPREFAPDRTENYELGTKGEFLDRRLSADVSVYYIDWRNIQLSVYDPLTFLSYVANASQAKSQGAELSLGATPLTGLTVKAWLTFSDAVLKASLPANDFAAATAGDRLPYSSRFSGNSSIDYEFPLAAHLDGFVGAATSYVGNRYGLFTAPMQQRAVMPAYAKTDLKAGLKFAPWTLVFYANNVTDKRGVLNSGNPDFPNSVYYITPRLVGFSLNCTF